MDKNLEELQKVNELIKSGEKVYKACNIIGIPMKYWYRNKYKIVDSKITGQDIKKGTIILYKGMCENE